MATNSKRLDIEKLDIIFPEAVPLTAAFVRSQITNSGLKLRLVFAVGIVFVSIESYFNLILKSVIMNCKSGAIHGYTQPEIAQLNLGATRYHTLCIDYSLFDLRIPSFVIASVSHLAVLVMQLNRWESSIFLGSVAWFIKMPVFHPILEYSDKFKGLPSGSGYTSIIGSMCNYYMLSIAIRRYAKLNGIYLHSDSYFLLVSSDDTKIISKF